MTNMVLFAVTWVALLLSEFGINFIEGFAGGKTSGRYGVLHAEVRPVMEPKNVLVFNVAKDIRKGLFCHEFREHCGGKALYFPDNMGTSSREDNASTIFKWVTPFREIQLGNGGNEAWLRESGEVKCWSLPCVRILNSELYRLIGFQGRIEQHKGLRSDPSALVCHHGIAGLFKRHVKTPEAEETNRYPDYCDPVEETGRTNLRLAGTSLLGISLIVLGGRLLNYGERLGDVRHNISWWSGYWIAVGGSMALIIVFISLASHWVSPML
jgi:hypothetical protein